MGADEPTQVTAAATIPSVAELKRRIAELSAAVILRDARIGALDEAVATRDTFIAVAAHELRNPMTPIMGQLELLLAAYQGGRCSAEQAQRRIERIQSSVRRFWKRAGVLLDVSRITSGNFLVEVEAFDLAVLLREVAEAFAEPALHAGVPITVEVAESLPGEWDRMAVEQIVDNLLSNALRYGDRTAVEISAEADGDEVRILVLDHGAGVPPEHRERIFDRFERVVGRGERRSGFGVGLWLVRRLAEMMGGRIAVGDTAGGGAMFTVTLPRHVKGNPLEKA